MRIVKFSATRKLSFWQKVAKFFFIKPKVTYYMAELTTRWLVPVNSLILLNNGVKMLVLESTEKQAKLITIKRISDMPTPTQYFVITNNWLKT